MVCLGNLHPIPFSVALEGPHGYYCDPFPVERTQVVINRRAEAMAVDQATGGPPGRSVGRGMAALGGTGVHSHRGLCDHTQPQIQSKAGTRFITNMHPVPRAESLLPPGAHPGTGLPKAPKGAGSFRGWEVGGELNMHVLESQL